MDIVESIKMASTTLVANKLRSSLTMLGIIIGNASVIAMIGIGEGAQKYIAKELESLGPNVLFVIPGSRETQLITYRNKNSNINVIGTTPEFLPVRKFDVGRGRFLTNLDIKRSNQVVVLGATLAERFFGNSDPVGQQLRLKNVTFQVIGVL